MAAEEGLTDVSKEILEFESRAMKEHGPRIGSMTDEMLLEELASRHKYKKGIAVLLGTGDDASNFYVVFDRKNVSSYEVIELLKHAGAVFDVQRQQMIMAQAQGQQKR